MGEFITFPPMIIAPSLLAANFGRLAAETTRIAKAKADWLHLDIMDGHFVENISFGPAVVRVLRPLTKMEFDVHLMCSRPEILLNPFAEAGHSHSPSGLSLVVQQRVHELPSYESAPFRRRVAGVRRR